MGQKAGGGGPFLHLGPGEGQEGASAASSSLRSAFPGFSERPGRKGYRKDYKAHQEQGLGKKQAGQHAEERMSPKSKAEKKPAGQQWWRMAHEAAVL